MRRTLWRAVSMVVVLGVALMGCNGPNRSTQPSSASGFFLQITISPNALEGAQAGTSEAQGACGTIVVRVTDTGGRLVDGVSVLVSTTLGRFPAVGGGQEAVARGGVTVRGFHTDVICAKAERGTGILTATAEDAVATTTFTVF
jgi:hypothetical protein